MTRAELRTDLHELWRLALPMIVVQLGSMMLGVVDMMMVGHLSVHALDSVALGNLWVFGTLVFGQGCVMGIDPLVSQAFGAQDKEKLGLALHRGIIVALLASVPVGLSWLFAEEGLVLVGQQRALAHDAQVFALMQLPAIAPFLMFMALRQHLVGRNVTAPTVWVVVLGNVLNFLFDWVLIFGHLGVPALGIRGSGLATCLTRIAMFGMLVAWVRLGRLDVGARVPWSRASFAWPGVREVLSQGLPIGLQYLLEVWAFQIGTLIAGQLGAVSLGAHTIVLNLASISFMVPLGVSIASATLVGNRLGARDPDGAQRAAYVSLAMGAGVMLLSAFVFLALRALLPRFYTADPEVIALAASILPIAAAFQIFDGTQVVGGGVLRGVGRTRPAAVMNVVGYYVFALPLAWWLGFHLDWGLRGVWWGLALGLALVALMLVVWIRRPALWARPAA